MAADEGSRTSIALAQILLADRFDVTPSVVPLPISAAPDQSPADAVLFIEIEPCIPIDLILSSKIGIGKRMVSRHEAPLRLRYVGWSRFAFNTISFA